MELNYQARKALLGRSILWVAILGIVMTTPGCSWFRRKTKDDASKKSMSKVDTSNRDLNAGPPDSPDEHTMDIEELTPAGSLMERIYFDYDSADIRSDQLTAMETNVNYLKGNPTVKVLVEGHCDERGTTEYNFALGERRAGAVMQYLAGAGIAADRLRTLSKGEEEPAADGHGEKAWSKNRRCEFKFITTRAR